MRPFRIAWIVSRPRVGSMWTYNVVRALVADAGLAPLPTTALRRESDVLAEGGAAFDDPDPSHRRVLKTHYGVDPATPESLFIVPDRDPRDALVSLMRFAKATFADALRMQAQANAALDIYRPGPTILRLNYLDIDRELASVVRRVAGFLDHPISGGRATAIAELYGRSKVRQIVERSDATAKVFGEDGSPRTFDLTTGFQTGHVSDYRDGDWRRILSAGQRSEIERQLGPWLRANGYGPQD